MLPGIQFGLQWLVVGLLLVNTAGLAATSPAKTNSNAVLLESKAQEAKLLASGDSCRMNSRPAEGLMWYRQAALAGSLEAAYRAGALLRDGQKSDIPAQAVARDLPEGVRWTFWAATNMHPQACRDMSRILHEGLGVKTNLVQAYAWMRLFSELDPRAGAEELDKLALSLDAGQIQEAQQLAGQFKSRQWPPTPCKRMLAGDVRLTLNGLTAGGRNALAIINRRTIAEGETADIAILKGQLTVTCLEIRDQSVLVDIAGENETRLLVFR